MEFPEEISSEDKGNPEDAEGKAYLPTQILLEADHSSSPPHSKIVSSLAQNKGVEGSSPPILLGPESGNSNSME